MVVSPPYPLELRSPTIAGSTYALVFFCITDPLSLESKFKNITGTMSKIWKRDEKKHGPVYLKLGKHNTGLASSSLKMAGAYGGSFPFLTVLQMEGRRLYRPFPQVRLASTESNIKIQDHSPYNIHINFELISSHSHQAEESLLYIQPPLLQKVSHTRSSGNTKLPMLRWRTLVVLFNGLFNKTEGK
jgi:hypothetical protein